MLRVVTELSPMTIMQLPHLEAGDHLLYGADGSLVSWLIRHKTWSDVSHIEIYAGNGQSLASRNGVGVNMYPLRINSLRYVLRPLRPMNMLKGLEWFYNTARYQKYDFKGLMCFYLAVKHGSHDRMFCSEFATRFDRQSDYQPFHSAWDADKVAPGNYLMSPMFNWIMSP